MRAVKLCLFVFVCAGAMSFAQGGDKATTGIDLKAIDKSVEPCENFYQYACGSWIKNNPIPADQSRWGRFNELIERNNDVLRGILEQAAKPSVKRDATDQKIGDFYGACMNEKDIDAKGIQALKPELDAIGGMKSKADLTARSLPGSMLRTARASSASVPARISKMRRK